MRFHRETLWLLQRRRRYRHAPPWPTDPGSEPLWLAAELGFPAEELDEFDAHIVGETEIVHEFH